MSAYEETPATNMSPWAVVRSVEGVTKRTQFQDNPNGVIPEENWCGNCADEVNSEEELAALQAERAQQVQLEDGTIVKLRKVEGEDFDLVGLYALYHDGLSQNDTDLRFFHTIPKAEVVAASGLGVSSFVANRTYLTNDYLLEATTPDGETKIVGHGGVVWGGEAASEEEQTFGDVHMVVANYEEDKYRHAGLGRLMTAQTLLAAKALGLRTVGADILNDNTKMRAALTEVYEQLTTEAGNTEGGEMTKRRNPSTGEPQYVGSTELLPPARFCKVAACAVRESMCPVKQILQDRIEGKTQAA